MSKLDDIAAKAIAEAVAAIGAQVPPACYSSANLPPGYRSRDGFHRACREGRIRGAHKRGSVWIVTIADYHHVEPLPARERTERPHSDPKQRALASLAARGLVPKRVA